MWFEGEAGTNFDHGKTHAPFTDSGSGLALPTELTLPSPCRGLCPSCLGFQLEVPPQSLAHCWAHRHNGSLSKTKTHKSTEHVRVRPGNKAGSGVEIRPLATQGSNGQVGPS